MSFAPLAVPELDGIPPRYTIGVGRTFSRDLTLSLLDTGVIAEPDIEKRPRTEVELARRALQRRWDFITAGMRYFDWNLRIESLPQTFYPRIEVSDIVWASVHTRQGPVSCRHVYLRDGLEALEHVRLGLGQTVLATLYDAFRMLPLCYTPKYAFETASNVYWYGEFDETEAIEEMMALHDVKTREELESVTDVFTRRQFFNAMPEWAVFAKRVLTRRQVRRAAGRDDYAREVVDAMDSLWNIAQFYGPFADLRSEDIGADPIDYALVLRWSDDDETVRVADDWLQQCSDGEFVIASAVAPLKIVGEDFAVWLKQMESTALLAKAVERVLALLESRERQLSRIMVRV